MDLFDKFGPIAARAARYDDATRPADTVIEEVIGPCEVRIDGRPTLMFGSNNYLGLTFHPEVILAAKTALDQAGSGTTGSRVANGTLGIHRELERELSVHYGKQEALVFTTGYQANLSLLSGLCGPDDVLLIDADSHASIYDAARLSGAQVVVFRHNSADSLDKRLGRLPAGATNRLVVVEGLYSLHGDVAPLRDIVAACRSHGAYLLVDEAHSLGTFGARGLGCAEHQDVLREADFIVATFSKSLGGVGGFCVSDHVELGYLRYSARPYVFTASGSPANIAGVRAALSVLTRDSTLRDRLWANVRRLRQGLERLGYQIESTESPIVPIRVGAEEVAIVLWQGLLEAGLYTNIIIPPACAQDQCLLRASCSAAHTDQQIDEALDTLDRVGQQLGVLPPVAASLSK